LTWFDLDTQRDVQQRMSDALQDAECDHIHLTYYLTSIYDHSIYEAFSKIIQKLIRELPTLENLLNVLCSVSQQVVIGTAWIRLLTLSFH
jgi:Ras-related GTP-binding protein C/D